MKVVRQTDTAVEMNVEYGVLDQEFRPTASVKDAVDEARADGGVAWVTIRDPGDDEVESILDTLGLDRRVLLVVNRVRGHAGILALQDQLLVTLIEVDQAADDLASVALQTLVGPDHVVTLLNGSAAAATELRCRVLAPGGPPPGLAALAALLLVFFDRYDRALDDLEDTIHALAERQFPQPDGAILEDTYRTGQRVMRVGRAVRPLARRLAEIAADERFAGDAALAQAVLRLRTVAEALTERVTWMEQTLSGLGSTVLGLMAQRANDLEARRSAVTQRISAFALLFAIPNVIFALYGTNFQHLPTLLTRPAGFALLLALTVALVALAARQLRRNGWL
jgi:magnesium transporter